MSTKRKAPGKLAAPTVKSSARRATKSVIDESRTSVAGTDALPSSQQDAIEISSDEASDDGFTDEEEAAMADESMTGTEAPPQLNGNHSGKPALAGNLLNKLAARLYRRPGRAGTLMTWVQLTLIAHGGALASQPKVIQSLSGLQKVLAERAKGLTSLLALKGKLDMLESQMDLRRRMQHRSRAINQGEDEDEEEDVVWVEGEVEDEELGSGLKSRRRRVTDDDDDSDVPALNGAIGESSDEDDDSEEEIDDSEDEGESLLDEDERVM
ncbi:unnamed protein product, partial [Clonostachys rosea f. rosea IK726]